MTRSTESAVLIAVGWVVLALCATGTFASYVRSGLRLPLLLAGAVIVALGVAGLLATRVGDGGDHGHGAVASRVGFLLLVIAPVAWTVAPAPLGSFAANRGDENRAVLGAPPPTSLAPLVPTTAPINEPPPPASTDPGADDDQGDTRVNPATTSTTAATPSGTDPAAAAATTTTTTTTSTVPPSPPSADEVESTAVGGDEGSMLLYDFLEYVYFEPESLTGVPVTLVGFAAEEADVDGAYRLTRFLISCCAADAFPLQVVFADPPWLPDFDQWLVVEAVWDGELVDIDEYGDGVPVVRVNSQTAIDQPDQPYEY